MPAPKPPTRNRTTESTRLAAYTQSLTTQNRDFNPAADAFSSRSIRLSVRPPPPAVGATNRPKSVKLTKEERAERAAAKRKRMSELLRKAIEDAQKKGSPKEVVQRLKSHLKVVEEGYGREVIVGSGEGEGGKGVKRKAGRGGKKAPVKRAGKTKGKAKGVKGTKAKGEGRAKAKTKKTGHKAVRKGTKGGKKGPKSVKSDD